MNVGIIVAAGKSERMGPKVDKAFLNLGTKPVLAYSLIAYEKCPDIDRIILVVRKDRVEAAHGVAHMFGVSKLQHVVAGSARRQDSVANGLAVMDADATIVSIHDGARPCVTPDLISETVKAAKRYGSGVAAAKITDTVKYVERGHRVTKTVDRAKLWAVQTPQTFKRALLDKAFAHLEKKKAVVTDDAAAVEMVEDSVYLVASTVPNIKITTADDLAVAVALLKL